MSQHATELEQLQGAVLALREALEAQQQLDYTQMGDVTSVLVEEVERKKHAALTSTAELGQQIRDEIERKAKVGMLFEAATRTNDISTRLWLRAQKGGV